MRRLFLFAIILLLVGGGWFILRGANGIAERDITARLKEAGFTSITIGSISSGPRRTEAENITLDRQNIDTIKSISISRGWLPFSGDGDIDIIVESPDIYRHIPHMNALLPAITGLKREMLATLPKGQFILRNGRFNAATPLGDFQFLFSAVIDAPDENGRRGVTATARSTQTTLDFESNWNGWIEADGTMLVDTALPEIKAQLGAFRLMRGNGWLSLRNDGPYPALSGQIESGAAIFGKLPLQNFTLTLDLERGNINMLARARASGAVRTILSIDVILDSLTQNIEFTLAAADPHAFFDYLEEALDRPTASLKKTFAGQKDLFVSTIYQPAKRFAGGPYPFDLRGALGNREIASGAFLVYPDTFDMRGSAKIDSAYLKGITDYFKVPQDVISGDYIRLDASLSALFSRVGTGIIDDAGKGP